MSEPARKEIVIQGLECEVLAPYTEGHTITEAEAKALNQVRAENIRNNCARLVKKALADAGVEEASDLPEDAVADLHDEIDKYDIEYVFTLASVGGGRAKRTPVEVEARKIATAIVHSKLQEAGHKITDYRNTNKDKYDAAIAQVAEMEQVVAKATANVAEREKEAQLGLGDIEL